ncbi:hypothetical protein Lal_00047812 [Lupinus albus]|uniref:Uncharacterized protein n=1 Tax=Lupinus albus TaxID=3870 RepID=A0A6A4QWD1_LUPAL|nr:putative proteinase inhibitor I13, potato inhibitor I [Lupinus albus]KAF1879140.1 hypothetical protein Lal_00047812 [Lupinus albus]
MDNCDGRGKSSWPELVGVKGEVAARVIKKENPLVVEVRILHENSYVIPYLKCNRVWVLVDDKGIVKEIPRLG